MKEFLEIFVPLYVGVWFVFGIMLLLDWVFGIDKLNPMIDRTFNRFDVDVIMPSIMTMICSIICFVLFIVFDSVFFKLVGLTLGTISFGMLVLVAALYSIGKGLSQIRKYFLSRKNL